MKEDFIEKDDNKRGIIPLLSTDTVVPACDIFYFNLTPDFFRMYGFLLSDGTLEEIKEESKKNKQIPLKPVVSFQTTAAQAIEIIIALGQLVCNKEFLKFTNDSNVDNLKNSLRQFISNIEE